MRASGLWDKRKQLTSSFTAGGAGYCQREGTCHEVGTRLGICAEGRQLAGDATQSAAAAAIERVRLSMRRKAETFARMRECMNARAEFT